MARPVATSGGDARLGGGLGLGTHSGVEKPGKHTGRGAAGESIHRGGGSGLGAGKEVREAPKTKTVAGGKLPREGGAGLGTPGGEKPDTVGSQPAHAHYADPGYQRDEKPRLPTHTEAHTRASLRAFNKIKGKYPAKDQTTIGRNLALAAKRHGVDPYENAMRK